MQNKIIFSKCKIESKLRSLIEADISSVKKKRARKAEKYYEAEHDILAYRIFYINDNGDLIEDTNRSNIKISHAFYTEQIDQEAEHMLSKFDIKSKNPDLNNELKKYFNGKFKSELYNLVEETPKIGFSYMYSQLGQDFRTHFKFASGLGVFEVKKEDSDEIEYMVYYYIDKIEKNGEKIIKRIEVSDKEQIFYYVLSENELTADTKEKINPRPHKVWSEINEAGEKKMYGEGFGYLPFFRLDNNKKQFSNLKPIKELIDDYDLMSCGLSNNLQDIAEGIYVVKGFEGSGLDEIQKNLKTKKIIGVGSGGDVDIKTINIPYDARKTKLELDEKNIYRFGMAFNSAQVGDGNITNIVIKSRYTLLELKCNKLAIRLRAFLEDIVQVVLNEINAKNKTNYSLLDVEICLDREIPSNEQDNAEIEKTKAETRQIEINTILDIATYLPEKEVIKRICEVLDIDYSEIEQEIEDKLKENNIDLNKVSEILLTTQNEE